MNKSSKRRTRRSNTTDEDTEKKNEEICEIVEEVQPAGESTETEEPSPKEDPVETLQENVPTPTPETAETPKEETKESVASDLVETNGNHETSSSPDDLEPLVMDSEEKELEEIEDSTVSDIVDVEKSPVLSRCKTRRSQSRNVPTPKTPKSLDTNINGENEIVTCLEANEEIEENISVVSIDSSTSNKTQDTDVTNASIFVNFGDTTRNVDITTTTIDDSTLTNSSSFIDLTKEKSYGETLRCLTGRKTLRSNFGYKPRFYNSNIDFTSTSTDRVDTSKTYAPVTTGTKRKLEVESPGGHKKTRLDSSFFSYIASPFKSKLARNDLPSSTPKLTAFKFVSSDDVDNIENKAEPKKWCSVM